jgi:hypothetical protein
LAGLDAYKYPQVVSPIPSFLFFLGRLFSYVESNMDTVTWLGDLATIASKFLFDYLQNHGKPLEPDIEQMHIDNGAPGSDMLGNIDAYVISKSYSINT